MKRIDERELQGERAATFREDVAPDSSEEKNVDLLQRKGSPFSQRRWKPLRKGEPDETLFYREGKLWVDRGESASSEGRTYRRAFLTAWTRRKRIPLVYFLGETGKRVGRRKPSRRPYAILPRGRSSSKRFLPENVRFRSRTRKSLVFNQG